MPHRLRAVLLDIDGTVLDTSDFIFAAFEHAFAHHELPAPPRTAIAPHIGRPLEDIYAEFAEQFASVMTETHRDFQRENLQLARAFPGAGEALTALRDAGLRLAAVTSRSRRTSVLTLEVAGLDALFDVVISAEDAPGMKPDPAPLLEALARLGLAAGDAAMVGDTSVDIVAGRAAGVALTVAATYGFHGRDVLAAEPDAWIDAITELPRVLGVRGDG